MENSGMTLAKSEHSRLAISHLTN